MADKPNGGTFLSDGEWKSHRISGEFEYVVIGSSFCALGFIHQMLENNPNAKILIIERGHYEDFQCLSPRKLSDMSKHEEKFNWDVSNRTKAGKYIKCVHGMNNVFGGRSSFWKAWSPEPTREEMSGWPDETIQRVQEYFPRAKKLLNVLPVNEIRSKQGRELFGKLQETLHKRLETAHVHNEVEHITRVEYAPIAVNTSSDDGCRKYSAVTPLLDILRTRRNVKAVINCEVQKICHQSDKATSLETTKGTVTLGDAKLVLAISTLPSTTLMLNSFSVGGRLRNIGERFTGHFVSYITARVPFDQSIMYNFLQHQTQDNLEIAALYVAGEHTESKHQFHVQLTAVAVTAPPPKEEFYDCMRHLLKAPSKEQLSSSGNHIVFVCATLGQLDHQNADNWYRCINDKATLQVVANQKDDTLWDFMDKTTFDILELATSGPANNIIEYWHEGQGWQLHRPPTKQIRADGLVHPASTMWIGDTDASPVNHDYQFHGIENVYLTGGALWPTGASWNPTCTMTAMAMNLADIVRSKTVSKL